jgi:phosphoglycolate phosphatase-like HAD superfamily hydrolase
MTARPLHPAEIGFDFDGVIADTVEAFLRLACEQYGHCDLRPEHITHFLVEECLAMEATVVESIFTAILRDSVGVGLQPMPGAVEVLGELSGRAPVTISGWRRCFRRRCGSGCGWWPWATTTTRFGTSARPGSPPSSTTGPRPACS